MRAHRKDTAQQKKSRSSRKSFTYVFNELDPAVKLRAMFVLVDKEILMETDFRNHCNTVFGAVGFYYRFTPCHEAPCKRPLTEERLLQEIIDGRLFGYVDTFN